MEKKAKYLTVRISHELLETMRALAKQHTRSLNGEVIVALQEYAMKHQLEQKGESKG